MAQATPPRSRSGSPSGSSPRSSSGSPVRPDARPVQPFPEQHQRGPGLESRLDPKPAFEGRAYRAAGKLEGRAALVTGGDSGIGRAVAVLFAREGADVAIAYLPEEQSDAEETRRHVEGAGRRCVLLPGDLAPAYVFRASEADSSYVTGTVLQVMGGETCRVV